MAEHVDQITSLDDQSGPTRSRAELLALGADAIVSERRASVSMLQRRLSIGYSEALSLLASLASAGVVEEPNPEGRYHVALSRLAREDARASPLACHVRTLAELALYLVENHGYENSECVPMLAAPFSYRKEDLAPLVAEVLVSGSQDAIAAAALALSSLPAVAARIPASACREALLAEIARLPEPIDRGADKVSWRRAGMLRAVRYIERRMMEGITAHSRPFELFVHDSLLPHGRAFRVSREYREHVVPCAFLRDKAVQLLGYGISADEVSAWIEPYVRIVVIEKADAARLDGSEGLRDVMPHGWKYGHGCMYQRLHRVNIRFSVPAEGPGCACGTEVSSRS